MTAAPAQKGSKVFGDTWTGFIVAADEGRREVRLRPADEKKPGDFEGVPDEQLGAWRKGGSFGRPARVQPTAGERVLVNYKSKEGTAGPRGRLFSQLEKHPKARRGK